MEIFRLLWSSLPRSVKVNRKKTVDGFGSLFLRYQIIHKFIEGAVRFEFVNVCEEYAISIASDEGMR